MGSLVHEGSALAYRVQQQLLTAVCGMTQRVARRTLLAQREGFSAGEFRALRQRYTALLRRDLANVERGIYPRSLLFGLPWARYARALPRLLGDVPRILDRMQRGDWRTLPHDADPRAYPPYYRRTFHWQTDGYLSRHSAELYDVGVEFLFGGTADVMRRQCLVPLQALQAKQSQPLRILDLACGTGRTLTQIHRAMPTARLTGLDLSPYYLDVAKDVVGRDADVTWVCGNGEDMPLAAGSFDAVVSVFLFHELPKNARRKVWSEARRVLRPGGRFIVIDSVQRSDSAEIAYFVDRFSHEMHEPFYREYLGDDLAEGLSGHGFVVESVAPAYLAKVVTARTPAGAGA